MTDRKPWNPDLALERIKVLETLPGALLPILHALQEEFGYIDEAAVPMLARALNISQAEVHGTITFYHDFRHIAPGRHVLKVCRAEACQSMGCDALIRHMENRLGIPLGGTTEDGTVTFEQIFCLGMCATSPAVMLDGRPFGKVSTQMADTLIDNARRPM
jgi:formate dehydrogenase subunit gamma